MEPQVQLSLPFLRFCVMNEEAAAEQEEGAPPIPETSTKVSKPPVTKISVRSVPESETRTQCKFFLSKRGCTYGSDCKFLHQLDPDSLSSQPPKSQSPQSQSRDVGVKETSVKPRKSRPPVCRHYLSSRSGCKYGDKCRYRHPARSDGDKREERKVEESEKENERVSDVKESSVVQSLSHFPGLGSAVAGETISGRDFRNVLLIVHVVQDTPGKWSSLLSPPHTLLTCHTLTNLTHHTPRGMLPLISRWVRS